MRLRINVTSCNYSTKVVKLVFKLRPGDLRVLEIYTYWLVLATLWLLSAVLKLALVSNCSNLKVSKKIMR